MTMAKTFRNIAIRRRESLVVDQMNKVTEAIKDAAERGQFRLTWTDEDYEIFGETVQYLRSEGFEVRSAQQYGISISWRNLSKEHS